MKEYVSVAELRDAMYKAAFEEDSDLRKWDSGCWIRYKLFENVIESIPRYDVEPIRYGAWEDTNSRGFKKCSHCGEDFLADIVEDYEYCPLCGAKMGVEDINVPNKKDYIKDCLSCANSFSEEGDENGDFLHCSKKGWAIVEEDGYCDEWNA